MENKTRIGVTGCTGRMGRLIVADILSGRTRGISLSGGTIRPGNENKNAFDFLVTNDPGKLFDVSDVVIDFTTPQALHAHLALAAKLRKPLVVGTTGLRAEDEKALAEAARKAPILYSANMSVGVNLLLDLVRQAAEKLGPEWDICIAETHHRHKKDAPSGTALMLGDAIMKPSPASRCSAPSPVGRGWGGEAGPDEGKTNQKPGIVSFTSQRGGDVTGEHTVSFFGNGERIELTHRATDRSIFARGAIKAALWVKDRPSGLYPMPCGEG